MRTRMGIVIILMDGNDNDKIMIMMIWKRIVMVMMEWG